MGHYPLRLRSDYDCVDVLPLFNTGPKLLGFYCAAGFGLPSRGGSLVNPTCFFSCVMISLQCLTTD